MRNKARVETGKQQGSLNSRDWGMAKAFHPVARRLADRPCQALRRPPCPAHPNSGCRGHRQDFLYTPFHDSHLI